MNIVLADMTKYIQLLINMVPDELNIIRTTQQPLQNLHLERYFWKIYWKKIIYWITVI